MVVFLLFLFPKLPQKSDKTLFFFGPIFSTPHWTLARLLSFLPWELQFGPPPPLSSFLSGRFGKHKDRSFLGSLRFFSPLISHIFWQAQVCVSYMHVLSWERSNIEFLPLSPQKRKKEKTFLSPRQICEKGKSVWKIWRKEKERRHFSSFLFENWWSNHDGRKKDDDCSFPRC